MTTPARRRRLLLPILLVALLLGGAYGAARLFVTCEYARDLVTAHLAEQLQTSVTADSMEASFAGTTVLRGLTLHDDGHPYLHVPRVEADVSGWDLLWGACRPGFLDLRDAVLRLRFDRDGKLLTKLPTFAFSESFPAVDIRGARVVLEQEGRRPFSLDGAALDLAPDRAENLHGTIDDPVWGAFDVAGAYRDDRLQLTLTSLGVVLTPGMARALPFVPEALHRQLEFEGRRVPLRLRLTFGPEPPYARYEVRFRDARVRLLQPDRPAFVVGGAGGTLEGSEQGFLLNGALDDPSWGRWSVAAGYVAATGAIRLQLDTPGTSVDPAKLAALPYVPPNVWRCVEATGRTPANVQVGLFVEKPDVHYHVELAPRGVRLRVAPLDLEAHAASGRVVIEDQCVTLRDVQGRSASGSIATDALLDFRAEPARLRFDLDVRGLALGELPATWELPRQIDGKVTGRATLDVAVHADRVETRGSGSGRIDEARLAGFRTGDAIPLELYTDGGRIRFRPRLPLWQSLMSGGAGAAQGAAGRAEVP
jgi:hypothetical protein